MKDPILFRPPFGEYNNALVETCFELGYYPIQWSIDSLDWKDVSADYIVNRVMANAGPGEIVLLHNNGTNTAKAVAQFIPMLQKQGYRIVPISELIYKEDYYIEGHSGIQKSTKPPDQLRQQEGGVLLEGSVRILCGDQGAISPGRPDGIPFGGGGYSSPVG